MKVFKVLLFGAILFNSTSSISAVYKDFIGLDAAMVTVETSIGETLEPENFRLRLGSALSPQLDLEGHLGITVNSDEVFQASWNTDFAAVFLKGYLPIGRYATLYGMGGFSGVSLLEVVGRQEFSVERYGFAYGAGLEIVVGPRVDLSLDYINYLQDEGLLSSVSAVSLGLKFYY